MYSSENLERIGQTREVLMSPVSSVAWMHTGENDEISFANDRASLLFPKIQLAGRSFKEVLEEAEKLGLLSAETAAGIDTAVRMKQPAHLFEMRDGRSILLAINSPVDGHQGLEF